MPTILFAQEQRGKVEVDKDPKVDSLIENYLVDKKTGTPANTGGGKTTSISTDGYRVQIYSGSERKAAFSAQAKFQDRFPDQRTYISFREPNFKVRVGDYRTRLEAEKMVQELKPWYSGLFIISEKINAKITTE